ncbi:MAG: hypothetical protein IJU79_03830 [Desulfovibrionaceae bacterium]|nr:hypothetical protein [Desulfovibrionaceae bacterium]
MNKTINFKALAAELAALEQQGKGHGEDLLIARVLHNMSPKRWEEFCQAYPASNWGAIPVSSLPVTHMADDAQIQANSLLEDELRYAICAEKFVEQVERELLRMQRVGGELSVLATCIASPCPSTHQDLDQALAQLLQANLEPCDSMAPDTEGNPLLLLPGTGPVRSRHLAEQIQKDYARTVAHLDAQATLLIGLVSIAQGEKVAAQALVDKAHTALKKARTARNHLHQIGPEALDERSTLVHSDEKRFLFFGAADT